MDNGCFSCIVPNDRCAVLSESSIRDGLMYAMSALRDRTSLEDLLLASEDVRSQALMCSLFSAIAIGGLMLGFPVATVARHVDFARQCKEHFRDFADITQTVPALVLYAMSHAFIGSERSDEECRGAFSEAKAIHDGSRGNDPLVSCFMAYRNVYGRFGFVTLAMLESNNPFGALGRVMDTTGMVLRTDRAKRVRVEIERGGQTTVQCSQDAHPSFVLVDGKQQFV